MFSLYVRVISPRERFDGCHLRYGFGVGEKHPLAKMIDPGSQSFLERWGHGLTHGRWDLPQALSGSGKIWLDIMVNHKSLGHSAKLQLANAINDVWNFLPCLAA
jgi:hypothetical protein